MRTWFNDDFSPPASLTLAGGLGDISLNFALNHASMSEKLLFFCIFYLFQVDQTHKNTSLAL